MRTRPDELCEAFQQGMFGQADIDVAAVVDAIVFDIIDSAELAVGNLLIHPEWKDKAPALIAKQVADTLKDYYGNHYGEL